MRCQSCGDFNEQVVLKDSGVRRPDPPYHLCMNCLFNIVNHRLTKQQYFNLLRNGHKPTEFLLHDDFYDAKGKAIQPVRFRR